MTDKKCDKSCCDAFFDDYNQDEDDYEIQRLQDIIKICEFLIQTKKHQKDKKKILEKMQEETQEEENKNKPPYSSIRMYTYPNPYHHYVPYWNRIWF